VGCSDCRESIERYPYLRLGLTDCTDKNSIWAHIITVWRQPLLSPYSSFQSTDDFKMTNAILKSNFVPLTVVRKWLRVLPFNHLKAWTCVDARFIALLHDHLCAPHICSIIRHRPFSACLARPYAIRAKPIVVFVPSNSSDC